jgi:hypothetical protein
MPAKSKQLAVPDPEPMMLPLTVEQRRERVDRVRGLDRELKTIETSLLDAMARLPGLVREVQSVRAVIRENTAPPAPANPEDGASEG